MTILKISIRTLFIVMALLLPSLALAHSFEVDGIYYKFLSDNEVSVTYKGYNYSDFTNEYSGDIVIPERVVYNGKNYAVTEIDSWAFGLCDDLTSVILPNSVSYIDSRAFSGCTNLREIELPQSLTHISQYAFCGCSKLASIDIPNSVIHIGPSAFLYCEGLTEINIPSSVRYLYDDAFGGCYNISSITVDSHNPVYDSRDNCNAIIQTANNTLISGCKNTYIPNSVTAIGDFAFHCCSSLTDIIIPSSVTSIGKSAFNCAGLTRIEIPNTIRNLEDYVFTGCRNLTSIEIPNSVTAIGTCAFYNCRALENVSIGGSVVSIGSSAFAYCKLTSVIIPNSVKSIDEGAFSSCDSLKTVTIGNSVTTIGQQAFYGTYKLSNVKSLAINPPSIEVDTFESVYYDEEPTLDVPPVAIEDYQNHEYWGRFYNIQAIETDLGDMNGDGKVSINDVTCLIDLILKGGSTESACDVNGDGRISISDVTTLIDLLLNAN